MWCTITNILKQIREAILSGGVAVASVARTATVTFARPSNTTAYSPTDVIGRADTVTPANAGSAIMEFVNIGPAGGVVYVTDATLRIDTGTLPAGMSFFLHLFNVSPAAILDNALWPLPASDRAGYLGNIPLVPSDLGDTLWAQVENADLACHLATGSTSLFALLRTEVAYTPASGTVYTTTIETLAP